MARYSKPTGRAGIRALDSSLYKGLGFLLTCCDGKGWTAREHKMTWE